MPRQVLHWILLLTLSALMTGCPSSGGSSGGASSAHTPNNNATALANPGQTPFLNWENLGVHPIDISPNGATLLVCNTADHRLEVFDITGATPQNRASVPVGLDPVTVRARDDTEAWVANHISDSVSIIDLINNKVIATLQCLDEPSDIVFAGNPVRAFVSCAQVNTVQVFDPANLSTPPNNIVLEAEEPRALAVSSNGLEVYAAFLESGNRTTVLGGGGDNSNTTAFPPNVVNDPAGPHSGVNPPPNNGTAFVPLERAGNPNPPAVALIIRKTGNSWLDDTGADWTDLVSGPNAALSGRVQGWDMPDRDVAIINTSNLSVRYATGCMNACMALAVKPGSGEVTVVGTEATNEIRYEPNLRGTFVRMHLASFDPSGPSTPNLTDLNPHLNYSVPNIPQAQRDESIGDPRAIAWNNAGDRAFVTGMGSNNVIVLDGSMARFARIEVGEGPTGLVLANNDRGYVLNRFEGSLSVIDTINMTELSRHSFFDPTPSFVRQGRPHLYDSHATSGLGQASCASCHIDARMDRLAWDLGDPAGAVKAFDQNCLTFLQKPCEDFHPMKGPMTTQTLQDIIGKEPLHWRGDRAGLEEFDGAFEGLLGDDAPASLAAMQEFKAFLTTVRFPPNPNRNFDNSLPTSLDLTGHTTTGRFGTPGLPLPTGNPVEGLRLYRIANLDAAMGQCVACHTLPTGMGADLQLNTSPIPAGPNGERHHALVSLDGQSNVSIKIPQLRNLHEKVGFDAQSLESAAGFGFLHDGSVDTIARFIAEPIFAVTSEQQVADLVAFMLTFAGSDLPQGTLGSLQEPPGPSSLDTHAAVGAQVTFGATADKARLNQMMSLARSSKVDVIAKSQTRGWYWDQSQQCFQSDRHSEVLSEAALRALASANDEITFTVVPLGQGRRIGIDRDDDGFADMTEVDAGSNPSDPLSHP